MSEGLIFPYITDPHYEDDGIDRPLLPITLTHRQNEIQTLALVDSAADVNVLPYQAGIDLGGIWEEEQELLGLTGITEDLESRSLLLDITVGILPSIRMGFAWISADTVPVILGQVSFFTHFKVCFFRASRQFEIELKPDSISL